MSTCPHCGQPVPSAPAALVAIIGNLAIPRRERQIAELLMERHPRFVSKSYLCGRIFDDETEEVEWPGEVLQSHISKLRQKLIGSGWTIENQRFTGYRFVHAERSELTGGAVLRRHKSTPRESGASFGVSQRRSA